MLNAYWISPNGEVLDVGRTKTHIEVVISNPNKFGESRESIQKEYDKYEEQISWEGKAREVIMTRIIHRGWVRVREKSNQWTLQLWKLEPKMNDILWMWAKTIHKTVYDKYAPVVIYELSKPLSSKPTTIEFNELQMGKNVTESWKEHTKGFKMLKNVNELTDLYGKGDVLCEKYLS